MTPFESTLPPSDMRITICPDANVFYYSFYLQGIEECFSGAPVRFSSSPFPRFTSKCLALTVENKQGTKKIIIDGTDSSEIRDGEANWCDVYGKVNYSTTSIREVIRHKVIPIGPSFGVKIWDRLTTAYLAGRSLLLAYPRIVSLREHIANYRRQYKYRLPHSRYQPTKESRGDYIFHMSSYWGNDPETNQNRALFIDACRTLENLTFEGGFTPANSQSAMSAVADKMIHRRYSLREWLEKTEESCVAFNTPAVYQCHGWKLAEYLALGKAIISTSLSREMPAPLIHGVHVHFVEPNLQSMKDAVERIVRDHEYRQTLKCNARAYYDDHLAPRVVVRRLAQKAGVEL